jgi:hypothetical protein
MKDLWNDLARRVREANRVEESEVPFGFTDAVMRRLEAARREAPNFLDDWTAVLRPALGLAFGTALLCLLLQFRVQHETPSSSASAGDAVTQTEQMIQLALAND